MSRRRRPPGNPKLAVAYLRVSTEDQHIGPEAQRSAIEAWASRAGVEVVAWHVDQGVSGAAPMDQRPGLVAAFTELRAQNAGILVAAKRDRLARDAMIAAMIGRACLAHGAALRTADGASDSTGPEGALMASVFDAFAEYERSLIRARTKAALAVKKKRGERVGTLPYGCTVVDGSDLLVPEPKELARLATVRRMRATGLSLRKIEAAMKKLGVKSRTGLPYGKSQIHAIVRADSIPVPPGVPGDEKGSGSAETG